MNKVQYFINIAPKHYKWHAGDNKGMGGYLIETSQ